MKKNEDGLSQSIEDFLNSQQASLSKYEYYSYYMCKKMMRMKLCYSHGVLMYTKAFFASEVKNFNNNFIDMLPSRLSQDMKYVVVEAIEMYSRVLNDEQFNKKKLIFECYVSTNKRDCKISIA